MSRTWSSDSPNVQVGLDRVQQYMLFFLFQNKDSLVPQMGNVMAIGLTPSRTGIVIGPSRTGIVIGRLLNAQLRHMSGLGSECARCLEAYIIFILATDTLSASCIQFGFTKFVGVFPLIFLRF